MRMFSIPLYSFEKRISVVRLWWWQWWGTREEGPVTPTHCNIDCVCGRGRNLPGDCSIFMMVHDKSDPPPSPMRFHFGTFCSIFLYEIRFDLVSRIELSFMYENQNMQCSNGGTKRVLWGHFIWAQVRFWWMAERAYIFAMLRLFNGDFSF